MNTECTDEKRHYSMISYNNPVNISGIGDPFVLKPENPGFEGRYYLYATSSPIGFKVWSSDDLVHWNEKGLCYDGRKSMWAKDCFWAPECVEYRNRYYLFFSANWNHNPDDEVETFRIGAAVADSPFGPFVDLADEPLFDPGFPVIDANVFVDDDGAKYITYSRCCYKHKVRDFEESHIYGARLKDDMTGLVSDGVLLLQPCQEWENWSAHTGRRWNEGSFLFKRNGIYYIMFSANFYREKFYSIGYATSDKPLRLYRKYEGNPILMHDLPRLSGPGHSSLTTSPDGSDLLIVYHCHTDPEKGGGDRQVCIDRVTFDDDGVMGIAR
jgi:beta-xylosidase